MMNKITILLVIIIALSGCEGKNILKPTPFRIDKPTHGTAAFQQGWKDGCETGMHTMVQTYYKAFYKPFTQDYHLLDNPDYYKAWKDSYTYCRHYAHKWVNWGWDATENIK